MGHVTLSIFERKASPAPSTRDYRSQITLLARYRAYYYNISPRKAPHQNLPSTVVPARHACVRSSHRRKSFRRWTRLHFNMKSKNWRCETCSPCGGTRRCKCKRAISCRRSFPWIHYTIKLAKTGYRADSIETTRGVTFTVKRFHSPRPRARTLVERGGSHAPLYQCYLPDVLPPVFPSNIATLGHKLRHNSVKYVAEETQREAACTPRLRPARFGQQGSPDVVRDEETTHEQVRPGRLGLESSRS